VHAKRGNGGGRGEARRFACARLVSQQWLKRSERLSLDRIIHASHAHLASPSVPPPTGPLAHYCQRITQHIRSRHAIAQLSTCSRPYRFASSTRCVLPSISCDNAQLWRCVLSLLHTLPFNARPFQTRRLRPQKPSLLLSFSPSEEGLVFVSSRLVSRLTSSQLCAPLPQRLVLTDCADRSLG